jgi:hypothetical protein
VFLKIHGCSPSEGIEYFPFNCGIAERSKVNKINTSFLGLFSNNFRKGKENLFSDYISLLKYLAKRYSERIQKAEEFTPKFLSDLTLSPRSNATRKAKKKMK